jgi:hypothetical protein
VPQVLEQTPQRAQEVLSRFIERIRADRPFYFEKCLHIKTKDNRILPLRLNRPQQIVQEKIEKMRAEGKPIRIVLLKARREGMSTLTEANIFHDTTTRPFVHSMIVAHDTDSAYEIFSMSRLFYEMLPAEMRPMTRYSNRKELVFENPDDEDRFTSPGLRSKLVVDTASNARVGRAFDIHNFHGSEVAFWERPDEVMLGIAQAVPDRAETLIVLESTANGLGGFFYDAYMAAKEGRSDYEAVFLPWFVMEEYVRAIRPGDWDVTEYKTFEDSLTAEEQDLCREYGLSLEQVNWRRWAIRNKCGVGTYEEKKERFRQEYPSNDAECFLVKGQTVFNVQVVKEHYLPKCKHPSRGYVKVSGAGLYFEENPNGPFRVFEEPQPGGAYIIGADVAEGLEHGDASTGQVYDRIQGKFVAEYWGRPDPDLFGRELWLLGQLYNEAWLAVESNNHGLVTLTTLKNGSDAHGIKPYRFLFYKEVYDERTRRKTKKVGWRTDRQSKPNMVDALVAMVRDFQVEIPNAELCTELLRFVRDAKGQMGGIEGTCDDRVIAACIAVFCHSLVPIVRGKGAVHRKMGFKKARTGY